MWMKHNLFFYYLQVSLEKAAAKDEELDKVLPEVSVNRL